MLSPVVDYSSPQGSEAPIIQTQATAAADVVAMEKDAAELRDLEKSVHTCKMVALYLLLDPLLAVAHRPTEARQNESTILVELCISTETLKAGLPNSLYISSTLYRVLSLSSI